MESYNIKKQALDELEKHIVDLEAIIESIPKYNINFYYYNEVVALHDSMAKACLMIKNVKVKGVNE